MVIPGISKKYKNNLLMLVVFACYFLNQNNWYYTNTVLLNEPIVYKITYLLNDSYLSVYVVYFIYVILWKSKKKNFVVFFGIFFIHILCTKNSNAFDFYFFTKNFNTTLINGLLLIHPIFLYGAVTGFLVGILNKYTTTHKTLIMINKNINILKYSSYTYSSIALFLGCFWAQQETNWGGWWNWDPVEIVALLVWAYGLYTVHHTFKKTQFFFLNTKLILIIVMLSYFLSRFDILNSIHSFVSFSKNSKYLEIKAAVIFLIFCGTFKNVFKTKHTNIFLHTTVFIIAYIYIQVFKQFFGIVSSNYDFKIEFILIIYFILLINKNRSIIVNYKYAFVTYDFFEKILLLKKINFFFNKKIVIYHTLLILVFLFLMIDSKLDIFFKMLTQPKWNYIYLDLGKNIFVKTKSFENFNDFISKFYNKNFFKGIFDVNKRFFYQNIKTNFYQNINYANVNSILVFLQKNLFLFFFMSVLCSNLLYFTQTHIYKKTL